MQFLAQAKNQLAYRLHTKNIPERLLLRKLMIGFGYDTAQHDPQNMAYLLTLT